MSKNVKVITFLHNIHEEPVCQACNEWLDEHPGIKIVQMTTALTNGRGLTMSITLLYEEE